MRKAGKRKFKTLKPYFKGMASKKNTENAMDRGSYERTVLITMGRRRMLLKTIVEREMAWLAINCDSEVGSPPCLRC